jgi:hypothetical protein
MAKSLVLSLCAFIAVTVLIDAPSKVLDSLPDPWRLVLISMTINALRILGSPSSSAASAVNPDDSEDDAPHRLRGPDRLAAGGVAAGPRHSPARRSGWQPQLPCLVAAALRPATGSPGLHGRR